MKERLLVPFFSLFTSASTLVCCALPALFVALGMGAAFAGIVTQVPGLIWMSENKLWFFGTAAVMLVVGGVAQYKSKDLPCPLDQEMARACAQTRKWSNRIYFASVFIYFVGALFAFGAKWIA